MLAVVGVNFIMHSLEAAAIRLYFCRIPKFIGNVLRASFDNSFSRIDCFEAFLKEHQQVAE